MRLRSDRGVITVLFALFIVFIATEPQWTLLVLSYAYLVSAFIGQIVTVPKGIANGAGLVELGTRKWSLRGPDVPAGAHVRITGVDGRVLIVDRMTSR